MKNKSEIEKTINRITEMESIFDQVQSALQNILRMEDTNDLLKENIYTLTTYYESGQWLKDYEADERGELPSDLKRGVLSQDGIYDLLCEIDRRGGIRKG